jgi:hypothetical protein
MACVSPPELDDRTLLIYLDGQASADITAHIERCSYCRERAHRLAQLEGRLTTQLYRVTCPSPHELGEYHLDVLPDAQMDAIRQHLDECPHCRREVAQLEGYLAELAPTREPGPLQQVVERVRVVVARLAGGGSGGGWPGQLALAGVRGDESDVPLVYQAGETQVIVEIETDAERPDRKTVLGLVIGPEPESLLQAHLWHASQRVATAPVDELGNFVLPGLLPGAYELILAGPDLEIHIQHVQVGNMQAGDQTSANQ